MLVGVFAVSLLGGWWCLKYRQMKSQPSTNQNQSLAHGAAPIAGYDGPERRVQWDQDFEAELHAISRAYLEKRRFVHDIGD